LPEENHPLRDRLEAAKPDGEWHTYTLTVHDKDFRIVVDGDNVRNGTIDDHFDVRAPREIEDPDDEQPADWEDHPMIRDPEATKPEDWDDDQEEYIEDPAATQPGDWEEEDDGEWEPELIKNPAYRGKWRAPLVDNPDYIGPWKARTLPNPNFVDEAYRLHRGVNYVAIDVWTMTGGIKFKDIKVWEEGAVMTE
jgi:calreticulin